MWTMSPVIVFIMMFAPPLCKARPTAPPMPDWGSPEEFLKEVNEYRAKFAKERKIPNMYKLFWSSELVEEVDMQLRKKHGSHLFEIYRHFELDSYHNPSEAITKQLREIDKDEIIYSSQFVNAETHVWYIEIELLNPLQQLIGCSPRLYPFGEWVLRCFIGYGELLNFWYSEHFEAGSQCPPRFKAEDGLCVPVDPSKHTFWGTEDQLLEDVNYMRRKYAKEFGIPNMHQLTWNEPLVGILTTLNVTKEYDEYIATGSWDGFGKRWRITELQSFASSVSVIDEVVHRLALNMPLDMMHDEKQILVSKELIHPLQTSIGCMRKEQQVDDPGRFSNYSLIVCLLGNVGQWAIDWKIDVNSTKIPGSECMDGYVNGDGLCVSVATTAAPEPAPKNPVASDEKDKKEGDAEKEEEGALESSPTTRIYSYGPLILMFIRLIF